MHKQFPQFYASEVTKFVMNASLQKR